MNKKKRADPEALEWSSCYPEMKNTLLFQMHRIHSVMFRVANSLIHEASVPVKIEQLPVLMTVYDSGRISQQEVADIISRDKSSIQRTITALQKKGLVSISGDETDKRKNILQTTETGTFVALQIKNIMKKIEEEIFTAFRSEDRLKTINTIKATADKLESLRP
jgi:DNA-binding MarR family transcriptional regulator